MLFIDKNQRVPSSSFARLCAPYTSLSAVMMMAGCTATVRFIFAVVPEAAGDGVNVAVEREADQATLRVHQRDCRSYRRRCRWW